MSTVPPTSGVSGRAIKHKVHSNIGAPYASRFFHTLWTHRVGQLTTSNVRRLREKSIPLSYENADAPVQSDLQPHALSRLVGDDAPSLLICVPKDSEHFRNATALSRGSFMTGHTDPQLFHWFKQLGTLPPRAVLAGPLDVLRGDLHRDAFHMCFARHPVLHRLAEDLWTSGRTQTAAECVDVHRRELAEDERRMRRMSSSDWRAKFRDRERNPNREEDEERPVYVVKPDAFVCLRLRPEVRIWMNVASQSQRVWDAAIPDADPLCRCAARFIRMLNLARQKLVPALNMNFSLKLTNAFVFAVDQHGLWAMGTQENVSGEKGAVREEWTELRLDFGKGQTITTEQEMEWWVRGLTKLGAPEMTQSNSSVEDANMNPEDYDYRHI